LLNLDHPLCVPVLDRRDAERRNLKVNCVETSMDDLSEFGIQYYCEGP
jgi:hypothetical protein